MLLNRVGFAATLLVALVVGGCQFESTIDAKGGAELKLHYRVAPNTKIDKVAKDLSSKDVTVVSKSMDKDNWVDATIKTADVTKLPTAAFFKGWTVTLTDGKDKGTKKISARFANKTGGNMKIPPSALEYYGADIKIIANFPGDVVTSNATDSKGKTATWDFPSDKFFSGQENVVEATYKVS